MKEIEFKGIKINTDEKLCYINSSPVKLTRSEYKVLTFLMSNPNKIFSREELIKEAWTRKVSGRAVDTAMSRLRKKLGEYGKYIVTRLGFGYGFFEE